MNVPFSLSTNGCNNIWMEELSDEARTINLPKAINQWLSLYNFIAGKSLVYLIPSKLGLQDQVYVANLGIVLPHLSNVAIVSSYRSELRDGETKEGLEFFKSLGFDTHLSPKYFEGEADLKHLNNNIYVGGCDIRSSKEAMEWFEKKFNMKVIKLKMSNPYLYHLDTVLFPLSTHSAMLCTGVLDKNTVSEIEKHTKIIDVPEKYAMYGITNSVRVGKTILCSSNIKELKVTDEDYKLEREKNNFLETICAQEGFEPIFFNLSEFIKSGAMLSCCVMRLNYKNID